MLLFVLLTPFHWVNNGFLLYPGGPWYTMSVDNPPAKPELNWGKGNVISL